ncbi:MAG: alkaline phosphatase family protein [Vicinamibacterales bacterium]
MPEDTNGLKAGVLSEDEFLQQARLAGDEVLRQYDVVLNGFTGGFLFYYFGNVDQVSHMLWRARDPGHPAYDPARDARHAHVVEDLYRGLDAVVARTLERLGPDDLLVIMSDHGFTSWRRSFNLNSWLRDQGYLTVRDPNLADDPGLFTNVDWTKTRAYGLGLNALYINVRGRERDGIVDPADRARLAGEIAARLLAERDPSTGTAVATRVDAREAAYHLAGFDAVAPDLIVGYAAGTRNSDESALGGLTAAVLADNTSAWSGDHCMDYQAVPGILLSSRPLRRPAASIQDLAASILAEFGVGDFPAGATEH